MKNIIYRKERNREKRPFFSVLMLTYNHQEYIKEAILSIFNQNYNDIFEFIIINDASSDKTREVIENTISSGIPPHIHLKIVNNTNNIGSIENFNKGVTFVSGNFIVLADGDDISLPNRLSHIYKNHLKYNKSLYISNALLIKDSTLSIDEYKYYDNFNLDNLSIADVYTSKTPVFGASYAFDSSLVIKDPIDPVWVTYNNVDQNIFWRAFHRNGIIYIPESLLKYRVHINGASINRFNNGNTINQLLYYANRLGNTFYLYDTFKLKYEHIQIKEKIKKEFSNLVDIILLEKSMQLNNSDYSIKIGYSDSIIINSISYKRDLKTLKKIKIDNFIRVMNLLFLDNPLRKEDVEIISIRFKQRQLTKNEIIILFFLLRKKLRFPIQVSFFDKVELLFSFFKGGFRVLKMKRTLQND